MTDPLAAEKAFWAEHRVELSQENPGKFLLIKGSAVHGAFDTRDEAVDTGIELFGRGPFWACDVENPDPDTLIVPTLAVGVPLVART